MRDTIWRAARRCEGEEKYAIGCDVPGGHEIGRAAREGCRLTRASTGENPQALPIVECDASLLGVE